LDRQEPDLYDQFADPPSVGATALAPSILAFGPFRLDVLVDWIETRPL